MTCATHSSLGAGARRDVVEPARLRRAASRRRRRAARCREASRSRARSSAAGSIAVTPGDEQVRDEQRAVGGDHASAHGSRCDRRRVPRTASIAASTRDDRVVLRARDEHRGAVGRDRRRRPARCRPRPSAPSREREVDRVQRARSARRSRRAWRRRATARARAASRAGVNAPVARSSAGCAPASGISRDERARRRIDHRDRVGVGVDDDSRSPAGGRAIDDECCRPHGCRRRVGRSARGCRRTPRPARARARRASWHRARWNVIESASAAGQVRVVDLGDAVDGRDRDVGVPDVAGRARRLQACRSRRSACARPSAGRRAGRPSTTFAHSSGPRRRCVSRSRSSQPLSTSLSSRPRRSSSIAARAPRRRAGAATSSYMSRSALCTSAKRSGVYSTLVDRRRRRARRCARRGRRTPRPCDRTPRSRGRGSATSPVARYAANRPRIAAAWASSVSPRRSARSAATSQPRPRAARRVGQVVVAAARRARAAAARGAPENVSAASPG